MKILLAKTLPFLITALALAVSDFASAAPLAANCAIRREVKYVRGTSMSELFSPEQPLTAEMGYYACHAPARGDIALITIGGRADPIVKLVQIVPHDSISLVPAAAAFQLHVNGKPLQTPKGATYAFSGKAYEMLKLYVESFKGVVPEESYFVFGTEPAGSYDSSRFGPVTSSALIGRVQK